jgi:hypothetical protein
MPLLTVQNALVRSASVEIKSLTVSGRQITQAVFRQVPEQEILQADGSLAGVPWGWVNYWWKECDRWGQGALHVLWQDGGELRRVRVTQPSIERIHDRAVPPHETLADLSGEVSRCVLRVHRHLWWRNPDNPPVSYGTGVFGKREPAVRDCRALAEAVELRQLALGKDDYPIKQHIWRRSRSYGDVAPEEIQAERAAMLEEAGRLGREELAGDSYEAAKEELRRHCEEAQRVFSAWQASYATCKASGQLFIAC